MHSEAARSPARVACPFPAQRASDKHLTGLMQEGAMVAASVGNTTRETPTLPQVGSATGPS